MINPFRILKSRAVRALRAKARAAQGQQEWRTALGYWKAIIRLDGQNVGARLQEANMYNELGEYERARSCFLGIAVFPSHRLHAEIGLAGVAVRRADWESAKGHWNTTLALMAAEGGEATVPLKSWPMSPAEAFLHLAVSCHTLGDAPATERNLFAAFSLDPRTRRSREAWLMRSRLLARHDVRASYRLLKQAHLAYPDDFSIGYEAVKAAAGCGDRVGATRLGGALASRFPADDSVRALLLSLGLESLKPHPVTSR